jgi:hypothetical protein
MQKIIIAVQDDIDGSENAQTVSFSYNGVDYEIDLSPSNAEKFNTVITPYILAGRKIGKPSRTQRTVRHRLQARQIRERAIQQFPGQVKSRGRIPESIRRQVTGELELRSVPDETDVRIWALDTGRTVNLFGRVPKALMDEYIACH